jgi:hypothetical protein
MAPEPVKVALGGAHGNRITLRSVTEYVLVDNDAVVQALKNNPKVIEVITSVAKAQAKAGHVDLLLGAGFLLGQGLAGLELGSDG